MGEGSFVATYKHALLLALADLSVEIGDDTGAPLIVPISAISEKMIGYYWRQSIPYPAMEAAILKQNTGKQAAIIRLVVEARAETGGSLASAKLKRTAWPRLVSAVANVVDTMPLWKLQRVGDNVLDFLYPNVGAGPTIELRPGVAFCFRRFHGLVEDLVRGAWVRFVRSLRENQRLLGDVADLDEFLFGSERADLSVYRSILTELQKATCFYCGRRLDENAAIDHFIPWSRYPVDLGHNFVLAHGSCNGKKGDRLAAYEHLTRWCERNETRAKELDEAFLNARLMADKTSSCRIARWAYAQIEATNGLVWTERDQLVVLDTRWRGLFV